ncbi:COP23 domain-containing protein [Aerosakkonema sp. BLCC-F183]|uniref:COP23 domain-containing protein n=1 Tax=Aerosakkonema sp. BLCC-F183 TaxID=3342834 RepID=UPI0035B80541
MKRGFFAQVLTGCAIVLVSTATIGQSSNAAGRTFVCGTSQHNGRTVPATFVRSPGRRDQVMILWVRNDFAGTRYTPPERCQIVTERLQAHQNNQILKYIRTATVNNSPVLCSVLNKGGSCPGNQVIVTLRSGTNAKEVLEQLTDLVRRQRGNPVYFSSCQLITYVDTEAYLNIDILLGETSVNQCSRRL